MNLSYLSKTKGLGGQLKSTPEDFIVEEICEDGVVLELDKKIERIGKSGEESGKFTKFILQKNNWSTADAIREIAKRLRVSQTRFNFAGTKDKNAITMQLVSVFGIEPHEVAEVRIKDIQINGAWTADEKINLGALLGNRFRIRVNGIKIKNLEEEQTKEVERMVKRIYDEIGGRFPNYFGEQRFGTTRRNTHRIGELIVNGDFEGAVTEYLTNSTGEENDHASAARKQLLETGNYAAALREFPKHLRLERSMIAHLAEKPGDYVGALKKLPRNILLMFVHALQSHMFNLCLSERIKEIKEGEKPAPEEGEYLCGTNEFGFPNIDKKITESDDGTDKGNVYVAGKLIGYETETNEREEKVLQDLGIRRSDFRVKKLPEISSKGSGRTLLAPLKGFSFDGNINTFSFSLPAGSYATVALREFIDEEKKA